MKADYTKHHYHNSNLYNQPPQISRISPHQQLNPTGHSSIPSMNEMNQMNQLNQLNQTIEIQKNKIAQLENQLTLSQKFLNSMTTSEGITLNETHMKYENEKYQLQLIYENKLKEMEKKYEQQNEKLTKTFKNQIDQLNRQTYQTSLNYNKLKVEYDNLNAQSSAEISRLQIMAQNSNFYARECEKYKQENERKDLTIKDLESNYFFYKRECDKYKQESQQKDITIYQLNKRIEELSKNDSSQRADIHYQWYLSEFNLRQEKEKEIYSKNQTIQMKQNEINLKDQTIQQKENEINSKNQTIQQCQQTITQKENELNEERNKNEKLQEIVDSSIPSEQIVVIKNELKETQIKMKQYREMIDIYKAHGKDGHIYVLMRMINYFDCQRNCSIHSENDISISKKQKHGKWKIIVNVNKPNVYFVLVHDENTKRNNQFLTGKVVENNQVEFDLPSGNYHICGYEEKSLINVTFDSIQLKDHSKK